MTDVTKKSVKDLEKLLKDKREDLRNFRFANAGSHTRNVREGRNTRREIAQILTELNARKRVAS
ncbi:50S ribosomal protein L29 [bacterium]|nr:50S ribosomal protein L29 [bacterium]|tara:strand:+ start:29764 stop:29955 length:192 start_codon:yes stop_codon:yes gene_type:complete